MGGDSSDTENESEILYWKKKTVKDYSGKSITKETVKVYYFTRVLFGILVPKSNSFKNRKYQSVRNRMVSSSEEEYYYKAFQEQKNYIYRINLCKHKLFFIKDRCCIILNFCGSTYHQLDDDAKWNKQYSILLCRYKKPKF